jgi:RNA polymerase sigma-70 factor (ECF subfamily)
VFGITRNKVRDYQRNRARRPEVTGRPMDEAPAEETPGTPPEVVPDALSLLLHRALELVRQTFSEQTWQAFWRVTIEGHAAAAVAAELGMSSNAVHIAKSRVLHRLRQEFKDLIPEEGPGHGAGKLP